MKESESIEQLREHWNELYRLRLPSLAKARDPVQDRWPVYLDHCFARIVLDNAIGENKPWTDVVRQPAVKNMTGAQLRAAIDLGERLATGAANLETLDQRSLELRGKQLKKRKAASVENIPGKGPAKKRQQETGSISHYFLPSPSSPNKESGNQEVIKPEDDDSNPSNGDADCEPSGDMSAQLAKIANSDITPFRKQTLRLLCQIPRGRYSTYQAMSDYITRTSHKTCARAVGNAMRNNPFAPGVPCHRILAADGSLGGFGGHWGEEGKFANKKHELLHEEGVRFDSRGKVKGSPFRDFHS